MKDQLEKLGSHFVGLWIYRPVSTGKRYWCVTFLDIKNSYWETDLFDGLYGAEKAIEQAIDVIRRQRNGEHVPPTGEKQIS